jgi:putative ABC transport system permease protein
MRIARIVANRLRSLFRPSRVETDLQRELDIHIEQLTRRHIAEGMPPDSARAAARREFGSVQAVKEQCRDVRRVTFVADALKDLSYAARVFLKSPGFTLTAVGSLALGIGANTAIFTIVHAFLLKPLPYDRPDRLVALTERNLLGNDGPTAIAPGNLVGWQQSATSFDAISGYTQQSMTLAADTPGFEPQRVQACACSGNLFTTLRVAPIAGRWFRADEDRAGAPRVAVVGYDLWQRQFAGAADFVGRRIRLNDQDYEAIGVMPRTFAFPSRTIDVWVPLTPTLPPAIWQRHDLHFLQALGRVRADVPVERAVAEIDSISAAYKSAHPNESASRGAAGTLLHEALVADVRTPLVVLLAAVACVLVIACFNLANLMLTRSIGRAREIGIRLAVGAGRWRIVRQLVTESVALGLMGGAAGLVLAVWTARALAAHAPRADALLPAGAMPIDPIVFVFAFAVAIATGVAVGVIPAIRGSRSDAASELKDGTRSPTAGRAYGRFRVVLVAAEVSLSLVLVVAAGLLIRSLARLYDVNPGMRVDHTLQTTVLLPTTRYPDAAKRSAWFAALGDRLQALPGVRSAGLTSCPPLVGTCNVLFFYIEGRPYVPGKFLQAEEKSVDPRYFRTVGVPVLRGRAFAPDDGVGFDPQHPRLGRIVVSQAMANAFFSGDDPIGKRIFFDFEVQRERNQGIPAPRYEIVGVVGDVVPALDTPVRPTLYRPLLDVANGGASIVVHTAVEPHSLAASINAEVHRLDASQAVGQARTIDELIGRSTADRRFTMSLFIAFAALAMLLAAIGLYGVVSYAVSQRTAELGVRMALGATGADVSRLVVMQGLKPAIVGVAIGVVGAVFASRLLRTMLFGVTPVDPLTFAVVPPALLAVAALACYVPAMRAVRLDPTTALRAE